MYFLIFNNKNSLIDMNLKIIKRPNIPLPERNYEEIPIEGKDGVLVEDLGTYSDIKIDVEFNFINRQNIYNQIRQIIFWLSNINDNQLFFEDDPDFYYKVKMVNYSDIERQLKVKGSFKITFICEAFRYYKNNKIITITTKPFEIYSPEFAYDSKPIIKVVGTGDITLTVNGIDILLDEISNHIILDSMRKEAYSETYENLNSKMNGYFFIFKNGVNTIDFIGGISELQVTPNWRSL